MSDPELESLVLYYQMKALTNLVLGFGQNDGDLSLDEDEWNGLAYFLNDLTKQTYSLYERILDLEASVRAEKPGREGEKA